MSTGSHAVTLQLPDDPMSDQPSVGRCPSCCFSPLCKTMSFSASYLVKELMVRLVLAGFGLYMTTLEPFKRFLLMSEWDDHKYPYVEEQAFPEILTSIILLSCLVVVPILVLLVCWLWKRMPKQLVLEEAASFVLGVSLAICINLVITELVKITYGRYRPDYFARCYGASPSDWPTTMNDFRRKICSNPAAMDRPHLFRDGRKSFPSAHSSNSFVVYVYLALFIYRKLCQIKNTGSLRLVVPLVPLLFASFIAITRTQDYRHFPSDVIVGGLLGTVVAIVVWKFYDHLLHVAYSRHGLQSNSTNSDKHNLATEPYDFNAPAVHCLEGAGNKLSV